MDERTPKNYWSLGNQIFLLNGKAWGIAPNLQSICLGNEADILQALKENKTLENPVISNCLRSEMNYR